MGLEERVKYAQMKARHRQKIKPWYFKTWGILSLLLIALLISFVIASAIYIVQAAKEYSQKQYIEETKLLLREYELAILGDNNNKSFGSPKAPLTIVQFSDFACPLCAQSLETVLTLKENYPEDVRFIHRELPTQPNSVDLALAAYCADEQNNYWQFYEQLFLQQERFQLLEKDDLYIELTKLSEQLNLSPTLFADCLREQRYVSIIANDYQDVEYLRLEGSPTWFINNHPVTGYIAHEKFIQLVNAILYDLYGQN